MPKIYKVLIDEDVYLGLKAESLLSNKTIKDTLSFMVLSHLSPDATKVLNVLKDKRASIPDKQMEDTSPIDTESPESRQSSVAARKGRPWKGGPPPFEEQHPEIATRVMELWSGGKRAGGLSRDAVAAKLREEGIEISAAQVEKIAKRARKKDI